MRVPDHISVILDGNRRWAIGCGFTKEQGYGLGLNPGLPVFHLIDK